MSTVSVETLNAIRNAASAEYAARVPLATRTNIATVGNAILSYAPTTNEFTSILIDKIAMTIISSRMATNPLKIFKKGELPFGSTIEEIFTEMATAEGAYDPTGANPLGRRLSDIKVMYHSENREDKYVKSISDTQLHKAFFNAEGVQQLLADIVNSIYSGAEYDEFLLMKRLLADYELNYINYEVTEVTHETSARAFIKTVRKAVMDLRFMSTAYNKAGVKTYTPVEDLALIINKDVMAHIDVDVLAKAFNIGKTDFEPTIVVVDDFSDMQDTYAVLIDKDFFMVYDTLKKTTQQYNADGDFTNHFFHIHQILSTSQFKNAVRFTNIPATIIGALTVTTVEGTHIGDTAPSVAEAKLNVGNTYMYSTSADETTPAYNDICDTDAGFAAWNGTADIVTTNGFDLLIVEVDNDFQAKAAGQVIATVKTS